MAQCIHAQLQLHSLEGAVMNCAVTQPLLIWRYKFARASKNPLNQACKSWPSSSFSFPAKDLTSNCHEAEQFEFEIIVPTTSNQYENNKSSNISSASFLFDFGFQNQKVRLAW